ARTHARLSGSAREWQFRSDGNQVCVLEPNRVEPEVTSPQPQRLELLSRLEKGPIGARGADGVLRVGRTERAGCALFGPYLHLAEGRYRLHFESRSGLPRWSEQPVLGVEVIVLARFQLAWRDFTAAELAAGAASVDFTVPHEHGIAGGNEGRFEFRFFHFGNADLAIEAASLESLREAVPVAAEPARWRL